MKARIYILSVFLTLGLYACKDTQKEVPAEPMQPTTEAPVQNEAQSSTPTSTDNQVASNLNPAHGEPGHRCDIPVGAPLDTPPQQNNMQAAPQATPSSNGGAPFLVNDEAKTRMQNGSETTANSGKVNPPHGQPGHRCDIPVGQPL